jgi:hypothetical protein
MIGGKLNSTTNIQRLFHPIDDAIPPLNAILALTFGYLVFSFTFLLPLLNDVGMSGLL